MVINLFNNAFSTTDITRGRREGLLTFHGGKDLDVFFWVMIPCSLSYCYGRFGGTFCILLDKDEDGGKRFLPKVSNDLPVYTMLEPRTSQSKANYYYYYYYYLVYLIKLSAA
jgi:hypothetical protein